MPVRLHSARNYARFAFVATLCSPLAWAVSPGDQDLIRERQNRLLEEQQRRLEDLRNLPGESAQPTQQQRPEDTRCFDIHTIELKGADSLSAADRDSLLKPFIDQCLGVTQLNALLKAITDHYLGRGLVTSRAYLPQQDLSSGHLQVLVVEGRLEGLRPDPASGLSERELAMVFPGEVEQRLNLREVEQMVDQLNRLPSNKAQMELTPGKAVGGSEVLVRNTQQKPWRASLSRNNEGQRSTGEQMLNLGLEWDSPLGLADQLMLRGGHDVVSDHTQGSKNGVLYYNLPWGWWNFTYSYSESEYRSLAQANGFAFKQTGDSQNHQLRAERVVHRDATSKTSLNAGMAHLRTNNYIEDSRLEGSSNRLSEAQFGINHGRRLGNAFVNIDLGTQEGIGAFDAQDNAHPRPGQPVARYRKYSATVSYVQGFELFGERLSFTSLATGQRSEDVLFSPQRISLGGLSSVRGLKDQSLSGDSGGYWRNDLRWTRPVSWPLLQPLVAEYGLGLGYDLGVIRNDRYNGQYHGRASSHSLELFARGQHMAASVTFAHSLERPDVLTEKERPVYFRLDFFI
ncbi:MULTISPECIES: ShlB/FhaC/HecB family hemolysin secretion/activation protein [unclassified Pseudomonas]|uniref:ShlB/FhaC/HecB family hemolysin secretion/activation protein n=1 Tax=unclassified Pseudomonas TaxID=196821 RepID=UPI000C887C77|nr:MULTISPECIES: ShlB/FhaC/HecB family hemolysin secretion/activation protein [unclassified Pseudomonas]PMZ87791.1 ShlB family hemolysin secretion/activation protein [Pseudomonas sp. FW305-42]PNA19526.1 ShlB family hemolysin secretion/activation protein [Pseudomonas sp. MPR-R1B]PNB19264.1 ShlB family hemolysin secretion/activation protein [Pseudomonas sp. DP16D-E2]PNB40466.1 ShlB family hemolysin secretion/activation protein [Pseudomonas sp. FW305-17]PNB55340.1 ShlB family hemolysin secretion/